MQVESVQDSLAAALIPVLAIVAPVVSVSSPAQPSVEVVHDPVRQQITTLQSTAIERLDQMLRADDLAAGDTLREVMPVLVEVFSAESLARLRRMIDQFDYTSALEVLRAGRGARESGD
jgi:hypothetical protein